METIPATNFGFVKLRFTLDEIIQILSKNYKKETIETNFDNCIQLTNNFYKGQGKGDNAVEEIRTTISIDPDGTCRTVNIGIKLHFDKTLLMYAEQLNYMNGSFMTFHLNRIIDKKGITGEFLKTYCAYLSELINSGDF